MFAADKSKPPIAFLIVKPNTSEELNPSCPMPPIPSHTSGVEFLHGLTLGDPFLSKPSSIVKCS